jgi:hypothetical protein
MNNANHRVQVSDLLDEWTNNPKQAKNIINCLVEFLAGDLYWLNENISKVDRETLVAAAKRLEHSEAPNASVRGEPQGESRST